ncbi:MAG: hypothetical protein ACKPB7_28505, partial [Sphaerospermopsis kisseleviana]
MSLPHNAMPKTTPKSKLETAQEKLQQVANTQNTPQAVNVSTPKVPTTGSFNPSDYLASNVFADSSTLPKTSKVEADKQIQSIHEKRETLRLIGANLQLNTEAFKVGSLAEKMNQAGITYQTEGINTQAKMI